MKSINISGHIREGRGKATAGQLRAEGYVPCELYGKSGNVHFKVFVNDFKHLVYSPDVNIIDLDIDGKHFNALVKEVQFHPVSDEILHVDFHEFEDDKQVKLELPIRFIGVAAGVREGGKLVKRLRTLKVKGFPKDMPDAIEVDISSLGLGKSIKVREVSAGKLEIMNAISIPVAAVEVPRDVKTKEGEAAAPAAAKPAAAAPKPAAAK
jgi:large subunit ribosomal protein L25